MLKYLTPEAMVALIGKAKSLRRGHKLDPHADATYKVLVDGEWHGFKTLPSLQRFLEACLFPDNYRVFRNFDKGVTVDLDGRSSPSH